MENYGVGEMDTLVYQSYESWCLAGDWNGVLTSQIGKPYKKNIKMLQVQF